MVYNSINAREQPDTILFVSGMFTTTFRREMRSWYWNLKEQMQGSSERQIKEVIVEMANRWNNAGE
jgi:hypothetical protein